MNRRIYPKFDYSLLSDSPIKKIFKPSRWTKFLWWTGIRKRPQIDWDAERFPDYILNMTPKEFEEHFQKTKNEEPVSRIMVRTEEVIYVKVKQ